LLREGKDFTTCRIQADGVESRVNRIPLRPVPP
jgi:hypothetical protein